MGEVTKVSVST